MSLSCRATMVKSKACVSVDSHGFILILKDDQFKFNINPFNDIRRKYMVKLLSTD